MDSRAYWIGFNLVKGVGAVRLRALLDYFGTLDRAWQAPAGELAAAGLTARIVENIVQMRGKVDLEKILQRMAQLNIQALTWEDELYPRRLRQIDQPPPVLYVRGELTIQDDFAVAIVGTRRMTVYGRQVAEEASAFLAANGVTVVSGLARGVDGVAHESALAAGGRTLAVLGCGVDTIYPPEHRRLAEKMMENGALLSDYAPGTPPDSANFPPRNRIISGLSAATIVVEASEKSGALITATFAVEQGRDVFAVPGGIHAPQSQGTNRLIRDGARPLLRMEELLDALEIDRIEARKQARRALPADRIENCLYDILTREPQHVDEIRNRADLPIEQVSATLAIMELKGMVKQVGGMHYVLARESSGEYRTD